MRLSIAISYFVALKQYALMHTAYIEFVLESLISQQDCKRRLFSSPHGLNAAEAKESRLLMEMKDLAHSPPSEEDHKSETKADGLESSIGQELAVPSRHKNSSVDAAGKSTEDEAVEITNRATSESGTNIATEISIATPRQQKEEERAPSAGTLRSPAEDESEATQETLHTPAEGLVKAQDPPAAPMTDSKQQVKSITSSPIQGLPCQAQT